MAVQNQLGISCVYGDFHHRFTIINMNDMPVPIGRLYIHFIHVYNGKPVTSVYSNHPGTILTVSK